MFTIFIAIFSIILRLYTPNDWMVVKNLYKEYARKWS